MTVGYAELHAKSFYSFGQGASHVHEMLSAAKEHNYPALALTDTNLCGALEFARLANDLGIRPITGGELTLTDGSRLTLLAQTRAGYSNISRLFTLANDVDRRNPRLDPTYLTHHSEGVVLLTGGRDGPLSRLAMEGRIGEACGAAEAIPWTGSVRALYTWNSSRTSCRETRTATGDWRESQERPAFRWWPPTTSTTIPRSVPVSRTPLIASSLNVTIDQALPHLKPNHHLYLKSPAQMKRLFSELPEAVSNTLQVVGAVHLQPQHGPGLHPARARRTPGIHGRELSPQALLRGRCAPLRRLRVTPGG